MPKLYKPFCDGEDPKANDSLQKQSMSSCTKKELFIIVLHVCAHIQQGSKGGAVVRALASHQCGPGSNPGVDAMCGLSLLLVLSLALRGFSSGTPVFPSP